MPVSRNLKECVYTPTNTPFLSRHGPSQPAITDPPRYLQLWPGQASALAFCLAVSYQPVTTTKARVGIYMRDGGSTILTIAPPHSAARQQVRNYQAKIIRAGLRTIGSRKWATMVVPRGHMAAKSLILQL